MPTTAPPAESSRRTTESIEKVAVNLLSEQVAAQLAGDILISGPFMERLLSQIPASELVQMALGAQAITDDNSSPDALEAAALLQKISADLAIEEALVAQLMKQHGL